MRKRKATYCKRCKCRETGKVWATQLSCAQEIGVSASLLYEHIRFNEPVNGLHYEHV